MSHSPEPATGTKRAATDDEDYAPSAKKPKAAKSNGTASASSTAKRKAKVAPSIGFCSVNKKEFGDRIKDGLW
ncbi:unnamed protein product [Peniophora sp. CBMAI 1063]|nr:unnamed protein product [Peniophora sp. CBMAI 1063]